MPKINYHGIVARPGTYKRKDGSTVTKTWKELKASFTLTPELNLSLGHPMTTDKKYRPMSVKDYIGRVQCVINEEKQVIEGIYKIYDEGWDKLPDHIKEKLVNDQPLEISAGFMGKTGRSGKLSQTLHDHIALLAEGENAVCPLGECGINVHMETDDGEEYIMQFEQSTSTKDGEPEKEQQTEEPKAQEPRMVTFTDEQFEQLMSRFEPKVQEKQPVGEAGADPTPEEEKPPEEVTEIPEEPSTVPEGAFPAGSPDQERPDPAIQPDGSVVVPVDVYHHRGKKKQ